MSHVTPIEKYVVLFDLKLMMCIFLNDTQQCVSSHFMCGVFEDYLGWNTKLFVKLNPPIWSMTFKK